MLAAYAGVLRTERGLDALVDAGRDLAPSLPRLPGAWPLIDETARLFELAGLHEEAADLAEDAWKRGGPAALLARSLRLRLVMGDLEGYAASSARAVSLPEFDPLTATVARLTGDAAQASAVAANILGGVSDPAARLLAAWDLFATARETAVGVGEAADRLARLFPGSPEAAMALAEARGAPSRVVEAPVPWLFATTTSIAGTATTAAVPPPAAAPAAPADERTFAVQAGSFKVRENADELAKDLQRAGFTVTLREAAASGATVWRVLAGEGLQRSAAEEVLRRLRDAGYAGLIVGD